MLIRITQENATSEIWPRRWLPNAGVKQWGDKLALLARHCGCIIGFQVSQTAKESKAKKNTQWSDLKQAVMTPMNLSILPTGRKLLKQNMSAEKGGRTSSVIHVWDVRKEKRKHSHVGGVLLQAVQMDPVRGEEKTSLTLCTVHWWGQRVCLVFSLNHVVYLKRGWTMLTS